jgi:uncharacterized protein
MKLEQSFEVTAPLERVWEALIDVERVAPCLPGAEVSGRNDDGSYDGTFKVKIGPTAAAYSGKLRMESVDETAHTATMDAQGTDRRGQGGAKATIVSSVTALGEESTRVDVATEYHITGRLARFGRGGMIEEISNRLLREFAKSLQEMVGAGGPDAEPAAAGATEAAEAAAPGKRRKPGPAAAAAAKVEAAAAAAAEAELAEIVPEASIESEPAPLGPDPVEGEPAAVEPEPEPEPAAPEPDLAAASPPPPPPPPPPVPESEPLNGLALVGSAVVAQAKKNPVPFALAIGFLVALRIRRRRRH